ncbi:FAD-dependent oxidoreductase [soil metagenome]
MGSDRVLVVGAGIGGLSAAKAMADRGIDTDVVERAGSWSEGTGIYLPGNAVRALRDLGVADPVMAAGRVNRRRRFLDQRGRTFWEVDVEEFWRGVAPPVGVHRQHLHGALLDAVGAKIRMGATVSALEQGGGPVAVTFSDGATASYGFVVGADGVHSTVRGLLFGRSETRPSSLTAAAWRFVTANDMGIDCWTVWASPGALLLAVPIDDNRSYHFASLLRDHPGRATDPSVLIGATDAFCEPARRIVAQALERGDPIHHSPVEDVRQAPYGRGRVLLIGDAAHAMAPAMAQGAALAMEDALVLADLLAAGPSWDKATKLFEQRRRPRIAWVQQHTDRQAKLANLPPLTRRISGKLVGARLWQNSFAPLRDPY